MARGEIECEDSLGVRRMVQLSEEERKIQVRMEASDVVGGVLLRLFLGCSI